MITLLQLHPIAWPQGPALSLSQSFSKPFDASGNFGYGDRYGTFVIRMVC